MKMLLCFVLLSVLGVICPVAKADTLLWIDDSSGVLGKVSVTTGAVSIVGNMGVVMTDIAFDPTGNLWGIDFSNLYRINSNTAAVSLVGAYGLSPMNSLVFSAGGTLYGASSALYTLNTATGAATLVGSGGASYSSSGDLAFVGGQVYLSSLGANDNLFRLDTTTGAGTLVGSIGFPAVYGMATPDNVTLYGVAATQILKINTTTGAGSVTVGFGAQGLGPANGTAFFSEAGAPVPEPTTLSMMTLGLMGLGVLSGCMARRRRIKTEQYS